MSNVEWPDYIDDYATCAATDATLRIIGDELDPDEVTGLLELAPTQAHRKGDPRSRPDGRPVAAYPTGIWMLSTEGVVESLDLRRHVDWILSALDDKAAVLDALRQRAFVTNVHAWWVGEEICGPTLSPKQLGGMARLGLVFDIDWGRWSDSPKGLDAKLTRQLERNLGGRWEAGLSALASVLAELYTVSSRTLWDLDYLLDIDPAEHPGSPTRYDLLIEDLAGLYADWVDHLPSLQDELKRLRAAGQYPSDAEALERLRKYRQGFRKSK